MTPPPDQNNRRIASLKTSDAGRASHDVRGLHPLDSGFVFAVRRQRAGRSRRCWFKAESDARNRAEYWTALGEHVVVLRYAISNEVTM